MESGLRLAGRIAHGHALSTGADGGWPSCGICPNRRGEIGRPAKSSTGNLVGPARGEYERGGRHGHPRSGRPHSGGDGGRRGEMGASMRRHVGIVVATALALSGVAMGPAVGPATAQDKPAATAGAPAVSWSRCDDAFLRSIGAKCGDLTVPLDYAHPGNGTVTLALSRLRHTAPPRTTRASCSSTPVARAVRASSSGSRLRSCRTTSGRGIRLDRLRPARRRLEPRPRSPASPTYAPAPTDRTTTPGSLPRGARSRGWRSAGATTPTPARPTGGDLLGHLTTTVTRCGTWTRSARPSRRRSRSTSTASPTAPTSARSTPRCSRRTCAGPSSTEWSTPGRLVPRQPRPGRRVPEDHRGVLRLGRQARRHLPPGQHRRRRRELYYAEQASCARRPAGGKIGRSEWTDIFLQAGYYVFGWEDIATMFSSWVHNQDAHRRDRRRTTAQRPCRRQRLRDLPRASGAPTPSGRSRSPGCSPTTPASPARRRSRPGATPGSTARARSGRLRPHAGADHGRGAPPSC